MLRGAIVDKLGREGEDRCEDRIDFEISFESSKTLPNNVPNPHLT